MHVGVAPVPWPSAGGIYQYSQSILTSLSSIGGSATSVFVDDPAAAAAVFTQRGLELHPFPAEPRSRSRRMVDRVVGEGRYREMWRTFRAARSRARRPEAIDSNVVNWKPHFHEAIAGRGVDLMIYAAPSAISFESRVPYMMAIHDLQHRVQPEFPEVSRGREWETREYMIRNGVRHATRILADSEVGKEDVLGFYDFTGISEDRIEVLPFAPSPLLHAPTDAEVRDVRARYHLPGEYLFYPAQFWPHKNHIRVVESIHRLKSRGVDVSVVLVGSHADSLMEETWRRVQRLVSTYGLDSQVLSLGYVPDDVMSALYAGAHALLFPTFFGPTNIPVVEAWSFGVPVVTSDIRGIREQTGDAAELVDPRSVDAIAEGIERVMTDSTLRDRLTKAGRERVGEYGQEEFNERVKTILERVEPVVAAEGFRE
jgi:glycosyltransferase involved in cell wall biosynthesis